jgi:hypothetical protein
MKRGPIWTISSRKIGAIIVPPDPKGNLPVEGISAIVHHL